MSDTAEHYKVNMGGGRIITVHTSALEEKTTAVQMLGTMAREMKELFAPYVVPVLQVKNIFFVLFCFFFFLFFLFFMLLDLSFACFVKNFDILFVLFF